MAAGCIPLRSRRREFAGCGAGIIRLSLSAFLSLVVSTTGIDGVLPADPFGAGALRGFTPGGVPMYATPTYPVATPLMDSDPGSPAWWADDKNGQGFSEDWYLPPALGGSDWGEGHASGLFSEESGYASDEQEGRRRCNLCKLMDATRGVTEEGDEGLWSTLLCRHCAQFVKKTISISTRCHACKRFANFGPVGGKRRYISRPLQIKIFNL